MGYLEQRNWIRYLSTKRPNELYVYHLTNKGYDRLKKISKIRNNSMLKTNHIQKIHYADKNETVKVFISYSWDNEEYKQWVMNLAKRLRSDGIEAILDQWEIALGDPLTHFMEEKIEASEYVLIICTPGYREKSRERQGGVGYEDHVMTAEIYDKKNHRKYIPMIAKSSIRGSVPTFLSGRRFVNLNDENYEDGYLELKSTLLGENPTAPPIRRRSSNE